MGQTYHIKSVKETSFDPDKYGNRYWNIEVQEVQGNILWNTSARPEVGMTVYGHTEPSKSGKSTIFKKEQKPDGYVEQPAGPSYSERLASAPVAPQLQDMSNPSNAQIMQAVRETYALLLNVQKDVKALVGEPEDPIDPVQEALIPPREQDEDMSMPVSLDEIPF